MTKKKVIVCDRCDNVVAIYKCEFCNRDICLLCQSDIEISLHGQHHNNKSIVNFEGKVNKIIQIVCCNSCSNKLVSTKLKSYFDDNAHKEIRRKIVEILKNALLIENLEDEKDKVKTFKTGSNSKKGFKNLFKFNKGTTQTGGWKTMMKGGKVKL